MLVKFIPYLAFSFGNPGFWSVCCIYLIPAVFVVSILWGSIFQDLGNPDFLTHIQNTKLFSGFVRYASDENWNIMNIADLDGVSIPVMLYEIPVACHWIITHLRMTYDNIIQTLTFFAYRNGVICGKTIIIVIAFICIQESVWIDVTVRETLLL